FGTDGKLKKFCGALRRHEGGATLIYVAVLSPILMGFAGLAVDVSAWYAFKRESQTIVDAAALGGALERQRRAAVISKELIDAAALVSAEYNGFRYDHGDRLVINWPPQSGMFKGNMTYIEAIDTTPARSWFARVILGEDITIRSRAVAGINGGDACVYALSETAPSAFKITGTADIDIACGVWINSNDPDALVHNGDACLYATGISIVGSYDDGGGGCIEPTPQEYMPALPDPLADVAEPDVGPCDDHSNIIVTEGESLTLSPGVYCGNVRVNGSGQLHFEEGLYIFNGAGLDLSAQSTITGDGITLYMAADNKISENININGGAQVDLTAPDDGPYKDILIFQSRDSDPNVTSQLTGGESMYLNGIVYAPNNQIKFAGGSELEGSKAMLIADTLDFVGTSYLGGFSEELTGLANVDRVALVE
ncbi:MAG: Tad domain-containing protein, partial [Alphaproteobacteria bacterium]|nr:Tad domain-containing protein [Alphaproteobacteria bacterium]